MHAQICTRTAISYSNQSLFFFLNPYQDHELYQGVAPPGLTYLTYRWRARQEKRKTSHKRGKRLCTCVCSNHPISPLINVQSSNMSLYSMFALLHCTFTITQDKQCACCIRSKQDLYVYTLFFEFITIFCNSFFFIAPTSKRRIPTFLIYCVSRHFLIIT